MEWGRKSLFFPFEVGKTSEGRFSPLERSVSTNFVADCTFEWRGEGRGCGLFSSTKLPQLKTISQQFCRRLQSLPSYSAISPTLKGYGPFISILLATYFISIDSKDSSLTHADSFGNIDIQFSIVRVISFVLNSDFQLINFSTHS